MKDICLKTIRKMCKDNNCICISVKNINKDKLHTMKLHIDEEFPNRVIKVRFNKVYIFKPSITRIQRILYYILYQLIIKK